MGKLVIAAYRPKPGQAEKLEKLVRGHVPFLWGLGLATARDAVAMRAKDGTIVEVFEWQDGAIEAAHKNSKVQQLWQRFAEVCDYVPLRDLPEASGVFAEFTPLESDD